MTQTTWIGIDVGTQSVRVIAVDGRGRRVGRGTAPLTSRRNGVRHEQDPCQWWSATVTACREALNAVSAAAIAGVAVDATSGTIVLADRNDDPVTAGLMYDDRRATAETERVNRAGGHVWARLGYQRVQPTWALPKLVWLLAAQPETTDRVHLLHQADVITRKLAGRPIPSDASHALKTGYDLVGQEWPTDVMDELGVPDGTLPQVVSPGQVIGTVDLEGAVATGIPAGTPIVAGMTDGCAAQIGAGTLQVGSWNSVLGTTLVLKGVTDHLITDPNGVVYCHRGPYSSWFPGGASSSGAGVLTARFPGRDLDELTASASREPLGPVAYPLVSSGERFPFLAASAEPFVLGDPTGEPGLFAALLTGVACVERLCLDYLDQLGAPSAGRLSFTGGGARNRYWCQLRSDLLGRPVSVPYEAEAAVGMAMLAASGVSGEPLGRIAATMGGDAARLAPNPARGRPLLEVYDTFVTELAARGWLSQSTADHARVRARQ